MTLIEELRHLIGEAEPYQALLRVPREARIGLQLIDSGEEATLIFGEDRLEVVEGLEEPDMLLRLECPLLQRILDGEADFGALLARSVSTEESPMGLEVLNPENPSALEALRASLILFTPGRVKVKRLASELAGEAHGGRPIPLLYWDGVRVAWYLVRGGETLNPDEERDPYPQLLIILKGRGLLRLEEREMAVKPSRAIYIPPNSLHQLRAEEDIELLWVAWRAF
jgi:mannose-6-phosphate isomerase-like protein (cupin superfamily)